MTCWNVIRCQHHRRMTSVRKTYNCRSWYHHLGVTMIMLTLHDSSLQTLTGRFAVTAVQQSCVLCLALASRSSFVILLCCVLCLWCAYNHCLYFPSDTVSYYLVFLLLPFIFPFSVNYCLHKQWFFAPHDPTYSSVFFSLFPAKLYAVQCFDAVGWATGRSSGL